MPSVGSFPALAAMFRWVHELVLLARFLGRRKRLALRHRAFNPGAATSRAGDFVLPRTGRFLSWFVAISHGPLTERALIRLVNAGATKILSMATTCYRLEHPLITYLNPVEEVLRAIKEVIGTG